MWRISSAVEQRNHNPLVGGSNPSFATTARHVSPIPRARFPGSDLRLAAALLTGVLLALLALPEQAWSQRQLPAEASFGEMTRFAYPLVTIGKGTFRMAPGGKIYNQQNLIIMPAAAPARANVLFTLDTAGELSGIWLLTAQEAARFRKPATPGTTPPVKPPADKPKDNPSTLGGN